MSLVDTVDRVDRVDTIDGIDTIDTVAPPGGIAQLVERQLCKLDAAGSTPAASTRFYDFRFMIADC